MGHTRGVQGLLLALPGEVTPARLGVVGTWDNRDSNQTKPETEERRACAWIYMGFFWGGGKWWLLRFCAQAQAVKELRVRIEASRRGLAWLGLAGLE